MKTEFQYIRMVEEPNPGKKTRRFAIVNKHQDVELGQIKWYGAWRQYCFFPTPECETIWNFGCLVDVMNFLKELKEERAAAR